ncbi:hypothetical protein PGB90_008859 [Kerria lacca]
MDLDNVLEEIGEFGKYQKNLIFFVFLPCMFPCAFHAYNQLFMGTASTNCCSINLEIIEEKNLRIRNDCLSGYNFIDIRKFDSVTKEFLICETNFRLTLALILFGIAGFIGSYLFGYFQDRIGRQPSFFLYLLIECIFGIATAFANNFWVWSILRFGVGFTVPAILSTPYVLPIELVGPKYRTRCTIYSNIAYSFGLVALAGIVFVFKNWRYLALITSAPFLLFFIYWWYMPESPRWLLASGRYEEAVKILNNMARINGTQLTNIHLIKLKEKFMGEKNTLPQKTKKYGVNDLFKYKSLRKKTIIITFIWFTNTSVYVGLSYYAPALSGDKYLNFFLAGLVELPTYIILWPTMEYYGRREILCLSMLIGGIACILTFIVFENQDLTRILYCVGKMGISSSYVVLPLFASELYPTVVRGIGMSFGSVAGMLGPVFIPIINYLGVGSCLPIVIMGILLILGGVFSLLLPETKNVHLPETVNENVK